MFRIEKLYLEYRQDIYRYLLSLTHDPVLSEDLLSETFVAAIKGILSFQERSSLKTWLFAIARKVWLSHLRRDRPVLEFSDLLGLYITEGPEDRVVKAQTAARVNELLDGMEKRSRTVVRMRIEGYPYHLIAGALGISESSARVIDFRTKKQIRSTLEKEGYNDEK